MNKSYTGTQKAILQCRQCGETKESRFTRGLCSACYQRLRYHHTIGINGKRSVRLLDEPEYHTWRSMVSRCSTNKKYLSNGIRVCERWLGRDGYDNFIVDMGRKPDYSRVSVSEPTSNGRKHKSNWTLDRIDNTKGYSPDNCRWANNAEQMLNRSYFSKTPGVCKARNKFLARIQKGDIKMAKTFDDLSDAIAWRREMELALYGRYLSYNKTEA